MPNPSRRPVGVRRSLGAVLVLGALMIVAGIAVAFPAAIAGGSIATGLARQGWEVALAAAAIDADSGLLLLRTARTALLIGVLATALAWPVAWAVRAKRSAWTGLMLAPMLMPSYLAYAGWGLLRSPGTWTGDLLSTAPPPPWSDEPGYWPLLAGGVLAVIGLALWAWPLAAVILAAGASRIDRSALEALRLEMGPRWQKQWCTLAMMRGSLLGAVAAVSLVMLGSAVPLHLAQMQTWAVHLWLLLDQTPVPSRWTVWLAAWPLIGIAAASALTWRSRLFDTSDADQASAGQPERHEQPSPATIAAAAMVWGASVIGPALLFVWFIPGWRALATFWRVHHEPFVNSLVLGAVLGVLGAGLTAASWFGLSSGRGPRRSVAACGAMLLVSGLVPGVLVGSATGAAWNALASTHWVGDSPGIVVLGHIARFGFLAVLVGAFLARSEGSEERNSRRLDGAEGFSGWFRACLPGGVGTVLAAGIATGILGFHEIEAAVILQPPGLDGFPRQMLGFLHFARMQELCVGAFLTIAVGVLAAAMAVACDRLAGVRWRR